MATSKLPLLLGAAAAFLLLKGKGGSQRFGGKGNIFTLTADNRLPLLHAPYIQVTSSFVDIPVSELEALVKPIADAHPDIGFILAGPAGLDRLAGAQPWTETIPDAFQVVARHAQGPENLVTILEGPDTTTTELSNLVNEMVAYHRAPYTPNG